MSFLFILFILLIWINLRFIIKIASRAKKANSTRADWSSIAANQLSNPAFCEMRINIFLRSLYQWVLVISCTPHFADYLSLIPSRNSWGRGGWFFFSFWGWFFFPYSYNIFFIPIFFFSFFIFHFCGIALFIFTFYFYYFYMNRLFYLYFLYIIISRITHTHIYSNIFWGVRGVKK